MTGALVPARQAHDVTWHTGQVAWFEYHCWESIESADADLWLRSHQKVTVLGWADADGWDLPVADERIDAGMPRAYAVLFADGLLGTVFEDELTAHTGWWWADHPPGWVNLSDLAATLDTMTA